MNRSRLHGRLQPTKNERSTTSTATTTAAIEIDHFSIEQSMARLAMRFHCRPNKVYVFGFELLAHSDR